MVATGTAWLGRRSASARARRAAARGTSTWVTKALVTSAGSLTRSPTMLTVTTGPGPASSDPSAARIAARSGHVRVRWNRIPSARSGCRVAGDQSTSQRSSRRTSRSTPW
jgi:hypothetical protein